MVDLINVGTDERPVLVDPRGHPKGAEHACTGHGTHVATSPGYAEGRIISPGELVPHGIAVAEEWMEEVPDAPAAPAAPKGKSAKTSDE